MLNLIEPTLRWQRTCKRVVFEFEPLIKLFGFRVLGSSRRRLRRQLRSQNPRTISSRRGSSSKSSKFGWTVLYRDRSDHRFCFNSSVLCEYRGLIQLGRHGRAGRSERGRPGGGKRSPLSELFGLRNFASSVSTECSLQPHLKNPRRLEVVLGLI